MFHLHLEGFHKGTRRPAPMSLALPLFRRRLVRFPVGLRQDSRTLQHRARLLRRGWFQQHLPQLAQRRVLIGQHPCHLPQRFHRSSQLAVILVVQRLMACTIHHSFQLLNTDVNGLRVQLHRLPLSNSRKRRCKGHTRTSLRDRLGRSLVESLPRPVVFHTTI